MKGGGFFRRIIPKKDEWDREIFDRKMKEHKHHDPQGDTRDRLNRLAKGVGLGSKPADVHIGARHVLSPSERLKRRQTNRSRVRVQKLVRRRMKHGRQTR